MIADKSDLGTQERRINYVSWALAVELVSG